MQAPDRFHLIDGHDQLTHSATHYKTLTTPNPVSAYILRFVFCELIDRGSPLAKESRSSAPPPSVDLDESTVTVRWAGWFIILLGMSLATSRLLSTSPLGSANDRSRWCTVWSLAERGTYQIDEARQKSGWDTIDLVKHNDHFYSTKPPLLPWFVTQLYKGLKLATGWTLDTHLLTVTRILLFLINVIPMTVALVLWRGMISERVESPFAQLFALALLSGGILLLPFLAVFNNHTVAATAIMIAVWSIDRIHRSVNTTWDYALAGSAFGVGICNELPSLALVGLVFLLLWTQVPRSMWSLMFLGLLVPVGLFFWTNYEATGGWRPFYSYYGTEKYVFTHEGVPSYWTSPRGVDANRDGFGTYLLHCTIGHHGWFSLTPAFVWALLAWCLPRFREPDDEKGRWPFLIGSVSFIVFAFYMLKTENYNYGGVSVALRWMQWLAPLWVLVMLPVVEVLGASRWGRCGLFTTLVLSVIFAWSPSDGPWKQSVLYTWMEKAGWIDYSDPRPRLPREVFSWIYSLPDGVEADLNYWVELSTDSPTQGRETLRISDGGPAGTAGMPLRRILFSWNGGQQKETILINRGNFLAGKPIAECVVESQETTRPLAAAVRLVSGLPSIAPYTASAIRYLPTLVQRDAIRCEQAYGYVEEKTADGQSKRHYTRNVWLSNDIPFGIVQMEIQIRDSLTSAPHSVQKFWLTKIGKSLATRDTTPTD